ncbi:MAG: lipopolysaccharide heptosyltransferase II [Candidatus Omnitrophota bacterium]
MKILFITLSNIGDVILTLPVLDCLRQIYPKADITVMVGKRPKEIFENNPDINRIIVYDRRAGLKEKINLFIELKKERFDIVIDLRNSFFGLFLPAKYKTSSFTPIPKEIKHMKERHLYKIRKLGIAEANIRETQKKGSLYIKPADEKYINKLLADNGITEKDRVVVISPGARSHIKRWPGDKFLELIQALSRDFKLKIILSGDKDDIAITKYILENSRQPLVDLSGKTDIVQLAVLIKKAACVITNDSALLHLASYLNVPLVAIFGPTDEEKYGPWSDTSVIVKKDIFCRPCDKAQCKYLNLKCMQLVGKEDVLRALSAILGPAQTPQLTADKDEFSRILIVRTDKIGDVLLSTPVIKALRDNYPHAYIAMMVSPCSKDIVYGNPYLDEVIIYDKEGKHKGWRRSSKFAHNLKKKRFDLAIILHPTNRVHLITYFAGIPRRVGYDRKLGILLTDRIKHTKQLGEKHELEYNLDLVRYLGMGLREKNLFMPIKEESEKYVDDLFLSQGINKTDKLLAIHPGASCPSKIWPNERFAEVADKLMQQYGFKILVVAGPKDITLARNVIKNMRQDAVNLAGKISLSQLASVIKRCRLFISNDSGPVHIASAVGTPVISIFGRDQKGLNPQRWGPLGLKDKILHKQVGCVECLAHNCEKEFACLKAISVDTVLQAADSILG